MDANWALDVQSAQTLDFLAHRALLALWDTSKELRSEANSQIDANWARLNSLMKHPGNLDLPQWHSAFEIFVLRRTAKVTSFEDAAGVIQTWRGLDDAARQLYEDLSHDEERCYRSALAKTSLAEDKKGAAVPFGEWASRLCRTRGSDRSSGIILPWEATGT